MSEAYLNGVGVDKNIEYAFGQLVNIAYARYIEAIKVVSWKDLRVEHMENVHHNYNMALLAQIESLFDRKLTDELEKNITWDYEVRVQGRDPVSPMP